ncbi:hypothetical protein IFM89_020013 [Coptis chinensis]|uniref:Carbohydrate kinase PfkB domain-containing protein n=1 Tax=Coptis chinensis TaxID=261450 RepID=A0A835MBX1_9MAGN|nr:hypothetical protein IFM89_020013 [Coptis chinensis]
MIKPAKISATNFAEHAFQFVDFDQISSKINDKHLIEKEARKEEDLSQIKQFVLQNLGKVPKEVLGVIEKTGLESIISAPLRSGNPLNVLWPEDGVVLARCLSEVFPRKQTKEKTDDEEEYKRMRKGIKKFAKERKWRSFELIATSYIVGCTDAGVQVIMDAGGMEGEIPLQLLCFVDILSPNETELERLTGMPTQNFSEISQAVLKCHEMGVKQVLVKLGEKGSALFIEGEEAIRQPIIAAAEVIDTIGAGDTFTAAFAVALVGASPKRRA